MRCGRYARRLSENSDPLDQHAVLRSGKLSRIFRRRHLTPRSTVPTPDIRIGWSTHRPWLHVKRFARRSFSTVRLHDSHLMYSATRMNSNFMCSTCALHWKVKNAEETTDSLTQQRLRRLYES